MQPLSRQDASGSESVTVSEPKTKRQADPDVARIRAVKDAAKKLAAAYAAEVAASNRRIKAEKHLGALIGSAPEAQRGYLKTFIPMAPGDAASSPA